MSFEIDRLTPGDVDDAWHLSTQAGWNQTRGDWRRLLDLFPETCFAGRIGDDLVATSTLAPYGDAVGWIGMVLVEENYRRRGYGGRIFERALDAGLERDLGVIGLDATDAGAAVYEEYGFEPVTGIDRWEGIPEPPDSGPDESAMREAPPAAEITAFDERRLGVDRSALLTHLLESADSTGFVLEREGEIAAYAIARPGRTCGQVGPVVGRDTEDVSALLASIASRLDGRTIVDGIREESTVSLLESAGFEVQRRLNRMTHEEPAPALMGDGVVGAAGFEWG
ncbi:MAG: GNAT family N-acetyltransferase [Halobacteriales archaeon]